VFKNIPCPTDGSDHASKAASLAVDTLLDGDPAQRVLEHAERESVDCIVMGSRGLSDVKGLILGSVSHKVSNRAACTCISVK